MGKTTGFLDYARVERPTRPASERVDGFAEFHGELSPEQRREQGGRCMNCGVPFCQSDYGCPLHNLIPEWNDEIFGRNMPHALSRLLKTNSFPEFTARVCPAPCENACVCSLDVDAVTVRDNELSVIEYGWANGLMTPKPPAVRSGKRVAVVGSGPAGLAAADRLNQRGHSVTVYERDDRPGGLLIYGIPGMKLDKEVVRRRIEKMEAEGVAFQCGTEIGRDISGEQLKAEYDAVILCCGARQPRPLGLEHGGVSGVLPALDYLIASGKAMLDGEPCPVDARGRHVVVVGNGDTATDCVATALRQGAASVTQLVRKPKPAATKRVWPYASAAEKVEYGQEEAIARFGGDPRRYGTTVAELLTDEGGALRGVVAKTGDKAEELPADLLLLATGFSGTDPNTAETFGLQLSERGLLGGADYQTEDDKVFACGDMRRGASLVVWAIAEGRGCARAVDEFLEGYSNL
ncbi:MAG: glutamate synthase subunit beta [Oscillospiraceae bacterium]|nr:glutamate synthase subunit beta [Oscillospiraceae bacterium]